MTIRLKQIGRLWVSVLCFAVAGVVAPALGESEGTKPLPQGWEPFSVERLDELRDDGRPVFVSISAEWCGICKVNELNVLSDEGVQRALKKKRLARLKGDWTDHDPKITSYLGRFGIRGIPLTVVYPANPYAEPLVLPEQLSIEMVLGAVKDL